MNAIPCAQLIYPFIVVHPLFYYEIWKQGHNEYEYHSIYTSTYHRYLFFYWQIWTVKPLYKLLKAYITFVLPYINENKDKMYLSYIYISMPHTLSFCIPLNLLYQILPPFRPISYSHILADIGYIAEKIVMNRLDFFIPWSIKK